MPSFTGSWIIVTEPKVTENLHEVAMTLFYIKQEVLAQLIG
jgi:hypothetical protein